MTAMTNNTCVRSTFLGLLIAVLLVLVFVISSHYFGNEMKDKRRYLQFFTTQKKQPTLKFSIAGDGIPAKIIHQSWKVTKLPPRFARWSKSWKTCFPSWQYKLWNDTENRDFIGKHYPWFLKTYDAFKWPIHRADSVRYLYLFHYGGIYSDLDNECLRPFEHLLANYSMVFGAMEGQYGGYIKEGYVQNSFMYSQPRHPFWLEMMHEIMKRVKAASPPEAIAGPITLVHCINLYRKRFQKDVKIYPPIYFNPNSWLKPRALGCKDYNAMSESDLKLCRRHYNKSYVIQYHTQTWGRGKVLRLLRRL